MPRSAHYPARAVAKAIVEKAAHSLHSSISAVVRRLHLANTEFPVRSLLAEICSPAKALLTLLSIQLVLAGGLLTHDHSYLAQLLSAQIKHSFPKCSIVFPSVEASVAAALLARNAHS